MAKETKFIEVNPSSVNSTIEKWGYFGWEMVGVPQEINYQTTHRTQETDKHYASEYTTTTNYVKITFQRDKSIPHYEELVELETRYDSLPSPKYVPQSEPQKPKIFGVLWIILTIVGLCLSFVPGIIIIIWRLVTYPGKLRNWRAESALWEKRDEIHEENDKIQKERSEIPKRARTLLQ